MSRLDDYIENIRKGTKGKEIDPWAPTSNSSDTWNKSLNSKNNDDWVSSKPLTKKLNKSDQAKEDSLSEDDLKDIQSKADKSEKKGILPPLYSLLEKASRSAHAITGVLEAEIKGRKKWLNQILNDPSQILDPNSDANVEMRTKSDDEIKNAMLAGWRGEKKTSLHDIEKAIAPEFMEQMDKNTHYEDTPFFSRKGWGDPWTYVGRAQKVLEFFPEAELDPVNKLPIGKLIIKPSGKVIAGTAKVVVEEMTDIGKKVAPHLTEKVLSKIDDINNVALSKLNKSEFFKKHLGKETESVFQSFRRNKEVASGKYSQLEDDLKRVINMSSENQTQITKYARDVQQEAIDAFEKIKAKHMNLKAQEFTAYNEFQERIDKIKYLDSEDALEKLGKDAAQKMRGVEEDGLVDFVKSMNQQNARGIAKAALEKRGYKSLANTIAHNEHVVNSTIAEARLESSKVLHKNLSDEIDKGIDLRQRFLKGEVKASFSILKDDIEQSLTSNKRIGKEMNKFINDKFDFSQDLVESNMRHLENKIDGLSKYNLEQFNLDGAEKVGSIKKTFNTLEGLNAKARKTMNVVERRNILKLMSQTQKELNAQLKTFGKESVENINRLSKTAQMGQSWAGDAVNRYTDELNELVSSKDKINKMLLRENINFKNTVSKLDNIKSARASKLFDNIEAYERGQLSAQAMKSFNQEKNAMYESLIGKIPKEFQPAIRIIRKNFEQEGDALVKAGLIDGKVPGYFPSGVVGEGKKLLFEKPGSMKSSGTGLMKHRVFKSEAERTAWVEEMNKKLPEGKKIQLSDALDETLNNHMMESEGRLAYRRMENEVFRKYEMKNWQDVDKLSFKDKKIVSMMRNEMDFIKGGGKIFGESKNSLVNFGQAIFKKVDRMFKKSLTSLSPKYHLVNLQGQPFLIGMNSGLKAFNPKNYVDGFRMKKAFDAGEEFSMKIKGETVKFSKQEMRDAINQMGMASSSYTQIEGLNSLKRSKLEKIAKERLGRPASVVEKVARGYTGISNAVDSTGRFTLLHNYLKEGRPLKQAANDVVKDMLDYNMLNSDVDNLLQGVLAFYSFQRRSLPVAVKSLVNHPEIYSTFQRVIEKLSHREKLTDDELNSLNGYDKQQIIFAGEMVNGVREMHSLGNSPLSDAYNSLNTIISFNPKMYEGKLQVPVQALLDWAYSHDSFRNKEIGNELPEKYNDVLPTPVAKALGLKKIERPKWKNGQIVGTKEVYVGSPNAIFMVQRFPLTSRLWNDAANIIKGMKSEDQTDALMDLFLNVKKGEVNSEESKVFRKLTEDKFKNQKLKEKGFKGKEILYFPSEKKKNKKRIKSQENTNEW